MKLYNFDRYRNGQKMAMDIAVHANSMEEAVSKASAMNMTLNSELKFRDIGYCDVKCPICALHRGKED